MRGLPPPPPDVVHLEQELQTNGYPWSIGFWLFNPSVTSWTFDWLKALHDDWDTFCMNDVMELVHTGVRASTCRLTVAGSTPCDVVFQSAVAGGVYTGGQAQNVAVGWYFGTGEPGRGSGTRTHLAGVPDEFVENNSALSHDAWANLAVRGESLLNNMRGLLAPDMTALVPGTVQRQRAGAPLPVATFAPSAFCIPWARVGTLRRRMPPRGQISPF